MKNRVNKFIFLMILISLTVGFSIYIYINFNYDDTYLLNLANDQMVISSEISSESISNYFREEANIIKTYSEMDFVYDVLSESIASNLEAAKRAAKRAHDIRIKELENYLIFNKYLTLDDLGNSLDFRETVVFPIEKGGYSLIIDETSKILMHQDKDVEGEIFMPEIIGKEMYDLQWNVLGDEKYAEGEYILNSTGERRYAIIEDVRVRTADSINLVFITTVVIDDYKVMKKVPENNNMEFSEILEIVEDYEEIFIVSKNGYILAGTNDDYIGININDSIVKVVLENPDSEVVVFGPKYNLDEELVFVMIYPMYREGKHLGYFMIQIKSEVIYDMIETNLYEFDVFLINNKGLLVSPLNNWSILVQNIRSESAERCLDFLRKDFEYSEKQIFTFSNYEKEMISGTYDVVDELELCLLGEYSFRDLGDRYLNKKKWNNFILMSFAFLLLIVIIYIICFKFNWEIKGRKKRSLMVIARKLKN
ncbi:hypothetical protein KAS08_02160 [Candidatus Pacearchaeota archaeon]|nr:hypothetical protein [Candidatus Pacearchaeota archaeon]